MGLWVDSTARIAAAELRAAGVAGISRYLAPASSAWKLITDAEYWAYRDAGIQVLLNWEYAATDWLGGSAAGKSHALQAATLARSLGYPAGKVIVGSADFDMTRAQWLAHGLPYARDFAFTLADHGYCAGVYGPWDVLQWCQDDLPGLFVFYWQGMSSGWSGGRNRNLWPGTHLWQRNSSTIAGVEVDINTLPHGNVPNVAGGTVVAETLDTVAGLVRAVDTHMATREQEVKDYVNEQLASLRDELLAAIQAVNPSPVVGPYVVSGNLAIATPTS